MDPRYRLARLRLALAIAAAYRSAYEQQAATIRGLMP